LILTDSPEKRWILSVYCVANVIIMAEWYCFTALIFVSML